MLVQRYAALICAIVTSLITTTTTTTTSVGSSKEALKKSIVFDTKTPTLFYCPQDKPASSDKMIVRARPLSRLCQFNGSKRPSWDSKDCYDDLDETQFACDEKKRFQIRIKQTNVEADKLELVEVSLSKGSKSPKKF